MTGQLIQVSFMLMLTIGFFIALMFGLKYLKRLGPKFSSSIEILGGASVSHKAKVVMIKTENKKILLGVTDNQINTLQVFEHHETFTKQLEDVQKESS